MKFLTLQWRRLLRWLGFRMPTNIPGSSASYPTNVVGPSDGDTRNAASVNTGLEDLADRTAYLKAKARITDDGVQRLRTIQPTSDPPGGGDLEISDVNNGDLVVLAGYGVFQYVTPSAVTIDDVNVFGADDGGTGRWLRVDRKLLALAKAVAALDSDGRLVETQIPQFRRASIVFDASAEIETEDQHGFDTILLNGSAPKAVRFTFDEVLDNADYSVVVTRHGVLDGTMDDYAHFSVINRTTTYFDLIAYNADMSARQDLDLADGFGLSVIVMGGF